MSRAKSVVRPVKRNKYPTITSTVATHTVLKKVADRHGTSIRHLLDRLAERLRYMTVEQEGQFIRGEQ